MELTQTGTFLLPDEGPRGRRGKTRLCHHVSCNVPPAHRPALRADAAPAFVAYMLAPESKDVVPGMEVGLIISPGQFGTVLKLEGNRVRVDFSASGGKSAVYHTQDELKPNAPMVEVTKSAMARPATTAGFCAGTLLVIAPMLCFVVVCLWGACG